MCVPNVASNDETKRENREKEEEEEEKHLRIVSAKIIYAHENNIWIEILKKYWHFSFSVHY